MRHLILKTTVYLLLYAITGAIAISVFTHAPYEGNDFPWVRAFIIFFATILLTKYFFYMTVSPWHDVYTHAKRKQTKKPYRPLVSVIVPAWNEEVGLVHTVETILKSSYRKTEIVVINDGSTDHSDRLMREFITRYEAEHPLGTPNRIPIIYRYKENGGKGSALNHGIGLSSGELILSIDADCALTPTTVGNFVRHFEDRTVMAAVGNVKIGNTQSLLGMLQYLEFLFSFYFKKADSLMNTIYIIGGAAGAFRRQIFDTVGLYNTKNITEDIDLSVRIQDKGMKIAYAHDAVVYTEGATTLLGLMKQRLRWKRGRFQTFADHRHLFFSSKREHNKLLTWLILPLAVFGDIQLFFEVFFLLFLYVYSLITNDFSSFISGIVIVATIFFVQMFDDRSGQRPTLYLLAPIGWLLFYITTVVEYHALIKAVWSIVSGKKVKWQRWKRAGMPQQVGLPAKSS